MVAASFQISLITLAFAALGAIVGGVLAKTRRAKRHYDPTLIGVLIAGLLCFLLLEALPALT
ncbi:MAG TPA: hypothetical protein VL598_03130 [Trinickia sp.]|jgi:hypothetical protein|uniref:hypothetical protein n=1 Tax=Trinickia sp. TaxID=2571163 RepID=UPI002BA293C3|nr:hypothetical protein [Trinickia sp.]HTI16639.1 hypothetical protein [Trinickia sp.]